MTQTFITIRLQLVRLSGLFKHLYNCNPLYKEQTAEGLRITIAANGDVERILRRIGEDVTPINLQEREQTE